MRKLVCTGLLLTCALLMRPAAASAEFLSYDGMGHRSVVTVLLNGELSGPFYAGEINWLWQDEPPAGFGEAIYTYCVDPFNHLTDPQWVNVESTDDLPDTNGVGDPGGKAAWLFNTFADGIRTGGGDVEAAGLQVAIWEAIYADGFSMIVSDQVYGGLQLAQAIQAQADYYLAQLDELGSHASAIWLDATPFGQDQITNREPGTPVAEPATSLLFLMTAPCFARFSSRRRSNRQPKDRA